MKNIPTLLRRELGAYFASILGYVVLMFFLVVMGVTFAVIVGYLTRGPTQLTAMKIMFSMFWLPSLVVVPMITMRLLAEEKRAGTLEMLMTAPVTDFEVVSAKYLGAVALYALMWALTGFYVLILRRFSGGSAALDLGPIFSGYLGVLVVGQFFIAIGLLASSMTKNQIAAALMCFAVVFMLLIVLNWMTFLFQSGPFGNVFRFLSPFEHMEDFARGIVDVRPLVLYLSGTVVALFAATRVVESPEVEIITLANESTADNKNPTLRQRRFVIGANVLAQIVVLLALAVMINWLVTRHYARFDWTKSGYYKLSDKTRQVLLGLKEPVDVIVFLPPTDKRDYVEKILDDVRNLLAEFQFHGRSKLRVEYVDPQRDLARARQIVEEYKLDSPDVIIFASGGRHKYVRLDEMIDLENDRYEMGGSPRVKAFKGEGIFLSAIQTVTEEESPKVYFLTGHGEHDPETSEQRDGYSELARYIKRDNITVQKWNLLEKQNLPADAGAIVIAGPRNPFTVAEMNLLDQYLKNKGRLLVLLDPHTQTGFETFLERWNVQADNDLAVAKGGLLLGTQLIVVDALGTDYAPHPITAKLEGVNTSFPYARSIRSARRSQGGTPDQLHVTELVKTPPSFWGETDANTERTEFSAEQDIKGPLPLAVAVETGKPSGVDVNIGLTRAVIIGTSRFVDNSNLGGGNLDFFMNSLNWLLQREQLVAVSPKLPTEFSLDMSPNQQRAVYALVIAGMPLTVVIIGIAVWLRRRK